MSELITRAELARRLGVSRAAVTLAINNLRLSGKAINGKKILYEEALRQWTSNTDPRREFGEQKVADINDIELQEPDDDLYDLEEDRKEPSSLREEKAREAKARRELLEHKLSEARDEKRDKAEVARDMFSAGRLIRQSLDRIPEISEKIAALPQGDVDAVRALLKEKVKDTEEVISQLLLAEVNHEDNKEYHIQSVG